MRFNIVSKSTNLKTTIKYKFLVLKSIDYNFRTYKKIVYTFLY